MEEVTTVVAGAALVSPWWMQAVQGSHDAVVYVLPFAGLCWILIQMYYKIMKERK